MYETSPSLLYSDSLMPSLSLSPLSLSVFSLLSSRPRRIIYVYEPPVKICDTNTQAERTSINESTLGEIRLNAVFRLQMCEPPKVVTCSNAESSRAHETHSCYLSSRMDGRPNCLDLSSRMLGRMVARAPTLTSRSSSATLRRVERCLSSVGAQSPSRSLSAHVARACRARCGAALWAFR